jgi:hypothetical protein
VSVGKEGTVESGGRTVWIVVVVIALLALLCCCVVVVGGVLIGGLYAYPVSREVGFARVEESSEEVFTVGDTPTLEVQNFAGRITIRAGESGQMSVMVTKRAPRSDRLNDIEVDIEEQDDGLRIETSHARSMVGNMAVDLEIRAPTDTQVDVDNGAGNVRIEGVEGEIRAFSGAGTIRVNGAVAQVDLETGAGEIEYQGTPEGACRFQNGAGNVILRLPSGANAQLELTTGIGTISLGGFDVDGQVSSQEVDGTIGTGEGATIDAHTGAGTIRLERQ